MTVAYVLSPHFADDLAGGAPLRDSVPAPEKNAQATTADDTITVARLRAGDESAYRALVFGHFTPLARFAFTLLGSRSDAEDVVQDVFATLWIGRARWTPSGSVRAYLFASVRNRAANVRRHGNVVRRHVDQELSASASVAVSSLPADDDERLDNIRRLISELTERQQLALALRYEHGMTHSEVAQSLGVSLRAAEQLVMRALERLRDRLK